MITLTSGKVKIAKLRKKDARLIIPKLPKVWMSKGYGPKRDKDFPPLPLRRKRFAKGYRKGI